MRSTQRLSVFKPVLNGSRLTSNNTHCTASAYLIIISFSNTTLHISYCCLGGSFGRRAFVHSSSVVVSSVAVYSLPHSLTPSINPTFFFQTDHFFCRGIYLRIVSRTGCCDSLRIMNDERARKKKNSSQIKRARYFRFLLTTSLRRKILSTYSSFVIFDFPHPTKKRC